jgi:hypothetical protein
MFLRLECGEVISLRAGIPCGIPALLFCRLASAVFPAGTTAGAGAACYGDEVDLADNRFHVRGSWLDNQTFICRRGLGSGLFHGTILFNRFLRKNIKAIKNASCSFCNIRYLFCQSSILESY